MDDTIMNTWYEVLKTEKSITEFLNCNWNFHDFRIQKIEYIPGKDIIELLLEYDNRKEGRLLRFIGVGDVNICTNNDYEADWLYECGLEVIDNDYFLFNTESFDFEDLDEIKESGVTYVKAYRLVWCYTDINGVPAPLPEKYLSQKWKNSLTGETQSYDFHNMNVFTEDWNTILKPYRGDRSY